MVTVPQQPLPPGIITSAPTGPAPLFFEGTVGVADMPAWLKQVPNGAVLQATVQGRVAQNTYSLLTAQGPLTISSSLALQVGTQLLFEIGPELQSQRLHLVGGTNPNPQPQPILTPTVGAAPTLPLPQAAAGQTLNAIVIRPADPAPLPTRAVGSTPIPTQAAPVPTSVPTQAGVAAYASQSVTASSIAPTVLVSTPPAALPSTAPVPGTPASVASTPVAPASPATSAPPAPGPTTLAGNVPTPATVGSGTPGFGATGPAAAGSVAAAAFPASDAASGPRPAPLPAPTFGGPAVAPPAPASPNSSVFAVTQAGEQVTVRIVSVTPPQPDATRTDNSAGFTRAPSAAAAAPPATAFAFFREGLAALLSGVPTSGISATPGQPGTATPAPLLGPTLTGTVIGNGAQSRPIIAVGSAILSLEAGPLQPGSQVQLVAQLNAPAATPNTLANVAQSQTPLPGFPTYPSLPAMIAAAQQIGGPTEQAMRAMLPQIGPQLAASLMVFASGVAKGDLRTLVGDSARAALERSARGRAALHGVMQEFEAAEEEARGTPAADWRALTLPVMTGGAMIEPIRLYLHQVSDEEAERNRNNDGGGQRFVVDLDLTQLGSIQIDGLAKQDRLDLVVRTPKPLPEQVREGLRSAFLGGALARGVIGGLNFQVAPRFVPDTGHSAVRRGGLMV